MVEKMTKVDRTIKELDWLEGGPSEVASLEDIGRLEDYLEVEEDEYVDRSDHR
jgi:hypothetical protein